MKYLLIFCFIVATAGCMAPYSNIKPLRSLTELNYPYDVKHQALSNDIDLAYIDEGSGDQTILFIHGLGSYIPAWKKNVETLKSHYRCIAVDLPGYGKSSKKPHSGMMEFYADVMVELIDKLALKNVIVAGHSMGGQIGITMALKYPDKVQKLVLIDPAGFESFTEGEKQWFREVMTVKFVKETPPQQIRANLIANFYNTPDDAEFMITDRIAMRTASDFENYCYTVTRSVHGMVDQPVVDLLDKIEQPTLIVFGENDNLIPNPYLHGGKTADIAAIGKSKIKNSQLVMIPQCGHFAQFEKAEMVNQAVQDFLK
ncbi:alpha/beta hydrolase [bacterium]|nr:alpha/beta hydrolase [bacterium]